MEIYVPKTTTDYLLSTRVILEFLFLAVCLFVLYRKGRKDRQISSLGNVALVWVFLNVLYIPYSVLFISRYQWAIDLLGYWFVDILYPLEQITLHIPVLILVFHAFKRSGDNRPRNTKKAITTRTSGYVGLDLD